MTSDDFKMLMLTVISISILPCFFIFLTYKDDIMFFFRKERSNEIDVSSFSYEVQRHALYLEKLRKVYALCKELDIDSGNYFGLTKKVAGEIDYVESTFNKQLGKETYENMLKTKEATP